MEYWKSSDLLSICLTISALSLWGGQNRGGQILQHHDQIASGCVAADRMVYSWSPFSRNWLGERLIGSKNPGAFQHNALTYAADRNDRKAGQRPVEFLDERKPVLARQIEVNENRRKSGADGSDQVPCVFGIAGKEHIMIAREPLFYLRQERWVIIDNQEHRYTTIHIQKARPLT